MASTGSPDSTHRLSTLVIQKAPVERCMPDWWMGLIIDKTFLDAEVKLRKTVK
jgi:hypothetical protein